MKSPLRNVWKSYLLRPLLYKAFARFVLALCFALLWEHFVPMQLSVSPKAFSFLFLGVFFGVCAWLVYLRMDGLRIPRLPARRRRKKDPMRMYGDMSDHVDDEIVSFEELEDDEKDLCSLCANGICMVIFLALSFLF